MTFHSWRARTLPAVVGLGAIVLSACGSSNSTNGPAVRKTTATFAELPGAQPNYILPLASLQYFSVSNLSQFQFLLYRPLYWFGQNGQVQLNTSLSLADPPVYSADGKSVTVTLKGWKWSNGDQITARDVQFWQNMVTANKDNWAGYSPGEYPDNVTSTTISPSNPLQIIFNLSQQYGKYFFTYNELSQITPLPQKVWDKESATGAVGDYDTTPAGAQKVYAFLDAQAKSIATYNTNPLWQVVSGPWKLKSMDTAGNVKYVPNPGYGGPIKPTLTEFDELPYTKDTAEFDQLRGSTSATSTSVDYGYLPAQDTPQKSALDNVYNYEPWTGWQITYFPENFTNPVSGPIFSQLYFRQVMQDLIDQQTFINKAFFGNAYPTYGPVPVRPASNFVDSFEKSNPYPYSPSAAVALLQANGWTVKPGGTSTCTSPGTGTGQCGAGIKQGAQASFKLEYVSGTPAVDQEMAQLKTDYALAGIAIDLTTAPFDTVIGNAVPCKAGSPCTWDMEFWGGGWIYAPDYEPTGDELWSCTGTGANVQYAGSDSGGYCDSQAQALIVATEISDNVQAMYTYEDYLAKQLPSVWMPVQYAQLSEINKDLKGTGPQDPLLQIYPENWRWS
jgi:peptide/nickel transport system substrate-binding protein